MTLSHKPLEELQALRDEVEAAIAAKAEPDYEAWRASAQAFWQGAYPGHDIMHPDTQAEVIRGLIAALPLAPAAKLEAMGVDPLLLERVNRQILEWSEAEPFEDWWQYQKDFEAMWEIVSTLAPAVPVDDAWIDDLAKRCAEEAATATGNHVLSNAAAVAFNASLAAIRATIAKKVADRFDATLARCARWPGECKERNMIRDAIAFVACYDPVTEDVEHYAERAIDEAFRRLRAYQTGAAS